LSILRETVDRRPGQNGQVLPFGFGLSYTNFGFSGLTASQPDASGNVTVGFTVTNTGKVAGQYRGAAEQLLTKPAQGPGDKSGALRGFQSISAVAWANWAV
jgi:beta-glucosidase